MTMIRKLSGKPPKISLPKGAIDTQMHMYLPGYDQQPGGPPIPGGLIPDAEQYRQLMQWLGIERVVITQGNAHQLNNSNLLASLAEMGDISRGIAAITTQTTTAELRELADNRVVGARIMDLPGGAVDLSHLESVEARVRDLGWMMTVQFNGSHILEHEPRLSKLKARWVLDHHGKFYDGRERAHIDAIKHLIDGGNVWFKFSGCYETSTSGAPDYEDIAEVAREIAAYAPQRIIWGSNWPHNMARTSEAYPDDAALTETVLGWLPDEKARLLATVKNPQELFGFPDITR